MRRSHRLQDLTGVLSDGRLHRAADLARRFGVSQRTIYRDVETLRAAGLPVEGTRGSGYRLGAPVTLPPLNLTRVELEALQLGMAVIAEAADEELQEAARTLAGKLEAALPAGAAGRVGAAGSATGLAHLPALRAAIRARQKLRLRLDGELRTVRPLELDYRGRAWTLAAWWEEAGSFLVARLDRIQAIEALPELFVDEPGKTLADYAERGAPD